MKIALTLLIQKEVEAENDDAADAKVQGIVKQFEAQGWSVSVEDDSEVEDEDGEESDEEEGGDDE